MNEIWNNFKCVSRGEIRGDCTSTDIYEAIAPVTVKQMCDYILSDKSDWGYIGITSNLNVRFTFDCEYRFEYPCDNKIFLSSKIANSVIKKMELSGGWSRADYILYI